MSTNLASLSDEELLQLYLKTTAENKLMSYRPYGHPDTYDDEWHVRTFGEVRKWSGRPWQLEFHNAGKHERERMTMCGNGTGKTLACGAEAAIHLCGRYPDWWDGYVFEKAPYMWIGSIDNSMQKIGPQKTLLGQSLNREVVGTGFLPKDCIRDFTLRQAGVKEVCDTVECNFSGGGDIQSISYVQFKTYEQGWRRWQSGDPNAIWLDEEPDENDQTQSDIFPEVQTRLVRNSGILFVGYTPLLGQTAMTMHFMDADPTMKIWWTGATWDDAPHLDPIEKARLMATYPSHQRDARAKGVPMMGEGRVFDTDEVELLVDPIKIPEHWPRICGIDFGMAHPAAACWLAWDRDSDTVYLYDTWRKPASTEGIVTMHANAIKGGGEWIPVAWPHDGEKRDPRSGERFADLYRASPHNVNMLSRSARYKNQTGGAQPQWPIIEALQQRSATGRFKVFKGKNDSWLEEYRSYHVKEGQIVSRREDALKASFYALMMLRYAAPQSRGTVRQRARNLPMGLSTA